MDKRINRFKLCDLHFHPYLTRVIERLPEEVREDVLNDKSFQILTDDDAIDACVLRYRFSDPVKTLVYLNTKVLKEPEHQLIHTIASEIAYYVLNKRKNGLRSKDIDELLLQWGFEKEVEAVRLDRYYDQWNDEGLGSLSSKEFNMHNREVESNPILGDVLPLNKRGFVESDNGKIPDSLSNRKAVLAGILTAVKEANIQYY